MIKAPIGELADAANAVLDWFYPPHCYHCEAPLNSAGSRILCRPCLRALVRSRIPAAVCPVCGMPHGDEPGTGAPCLSCQGRPPHFHIARSVFTFAGPAASIVRSFKFNGQFFLGPLLMRLATERGWLPADVCRADYDCVVPVPLHRLRERERGYNQALLLAEVVARQAGIPLRPSALVRRRYTDQQARLTADARWQNVSGAFHAAVRLEGACVLLVDDVMTTGATTSECSRTLRQARAAQVNVLTLVRAQA